MRHEPKYRVLRYCGIVEILAGLEHMPDLARYIVFIPFAQFSILPSRSIILSSHFSFGWLKAWQPRTQPEDPNRLRGK